MAVGKVVLWENMTVVMSAGKTVAPKAAVMVGMMVVVKVVLSAA